MLANTYPILSIDLAVYSQFRLVVLTGPSFQASFVLSVQPFDPGGLEDLDRNLATLGGTVAGCPYIVRRETGLYPRLEVSVEVAQDNAPTRLVLTILQTVVLALLGESPGADPSA